MTGIMAGKTKRESGHSAQTQRTGEPTKPLGHLGVKSSPFAPTDCKLVNQYMVRDRMTAHYKKLNKARAAVDTAPPKAWLVSQKMRDQARREAMKAEDKRDKHSQRPRPHSARRYSDSDVDRDEILAMMNADLYNDGVVHSARQASDTDARSFAKQTESEMFLVNSMVDDTVQSPSRYHSHKTYKSNIPSSTGSSFKKKHVSAPHHKAMSQQPLYRTQVLAGHYSPSMPSDGATVLVYGNPILTPRSADLIDRHKDKFTEEKTFQPRTLKTNRESKLSQFKYYNPPKRKPKEADHSPVRPESSMSTKGNLRSSMRPGTANTMESTDWMNDTLMSRDYTDHTSPSGVPRLDISLDKDHLSWLQDQSAKANLRSARTGRSEELRSSHRAEDLMETNGHGATFTLNGALGSTSFQGSKTAREIELEDEELQYLEFVKDVTNDILDRGIFTNRVLKQVFETHVIRRRHQLKEEKMREMLEDLRIDLGIPSSDDDDLGLTSTLSNSRKNRRNQQEHVATASAGGGKSPGRKTLPNLHSRSSPPVRGRTPSPEGKPPLPKGGSKGQGSRGYLDSTTSSLGLSQEYGSTKDGDSVFGTVTQTAVSSGTDPLQKDDTLNGGSLRADQDNGNTQDSTLLYQQQLQASLDHDSEDSEALSERPLHTQRSEEDQYTDRTGDDQYTDRTAQSSYRSQESQDLLDMQDTQRAGEYSPRTQDTQRSTEGGINTGRTEGQMSDRTVDEYTSVTEEDEEAHYTERTLTETARSSHGNMDDSEKAITPRRKRSPKSPKTPKYASRTPEQVETARSEDMMNVTESDSIEISNIEDY